MEKGFLLQREHVLLAILMAAALLLGIMPPVEVAGMKMWFYLAPALVAAYVTGFWLLIAAGALVIPVAALLSGATDGVFYPAALVSYLLVVSIAAVRRFFAVNETLFLATALLLAVAYPSLTAVYYYLLELELLHATLMASRYVVQSLLCIIFAEVVVLAAALSDWRWLSAVRTGLSFRPSLVQVAELSISVAVTVSLLISLIMYWRSWESSINNEIRSAAYAQLEDRNDATIRLASQRLKLALRYSLSSTEEASALRNTASQTRSFLLNGLESDAAIDVAIASGEGLDVTDGWSADAITEALNQLRASAKQAEALSAYQLSGRPITSYADGDGNALLLRFANLSDAEAFEAYGLGDSFGHDGQIILMEAPRDPVSAEEDYVVPESGEIVASIEGGVIWRDASAPESAPGLYMMSNMAPGLMASFKLPQETGAAYSEKIHGAGRARSLVSVWSYFLDFARAVSFGTAVDVLILAVLLAVTRLLVGRLIEPLGELTRIFESWRQFRGGELGSGAALQAMDSSGLSALSDIHSLQQGFRALAQDVMYGERRLSTIAANYDELLRSLPLGVLAVDGASRVQFLNDALGEMTGQRQDALQRLKGQAAQMLSSGTTVDEWQLVLEDASPKSLLLVVNHRLDERGQESGLWVIVTDLTEQKQTSAQLIQASKLATLGEMSTGMAHELNQPLNVISLATSNLRFTIKKGKATPDNTLSKLDRIDGAVHRAANIIDHMRAFGRLAGEGLSEINLGEVVAGACNLLGEQLKLANIALLNEVPDEGLMVKGNAIQLEQVLINLVNNAKDAIKESQSAGTITVDSEVGGGRVRVRVTDSGGGIPDHVLPHIFEPFFTTKPVGKGTGLGGSISYGIIREMQGDIWAENVSGGAQITISLPLVEFESIDTGVVDNA